MKVLEVVGGFLLGAVTIVVVAVGGLFAFGSMGRYLKVKNM
jgi:hypothetical protein